MSYWADSPRELPVDVSVCCGSRLKRDYEKVVRRNDTSCALGDRENGTVDVDDFEGTINHAAELSRGTPECRCAQRKAEPVEVCPAANSTNEWQEADG